MPPFWLGAGVAVLLLTPPLASPRAQEAIDPTVSAAQQKAAEDRAAETVETPLEDEELRRPAELFLFPETSPAQARLGERTALRSSTLFAPNVLPAVSRPDSLLRLGSFAIQPSVAIGAFYDDNVDAANADRKDEFGGNIAGVLRAQSLFERHSLGFQANVASTPFNRASGEPLVDWSLGADGRLDLTSKSSLSAAISGTYGTEDVESAEASESIAANGDAATIADVAGTVVYAQQLNRIGLTLSGGLGRIEAKANGDDIADEVNQRDQTTYDAGVGIDYSLSRRFGLFSELDYERADFDQDGDGGSRDSQSVDGAVGLDMMLGRTLTARLGVGYSTVFFDDSERSTEQNVTAQAGLDGAIALDRVTILNLSLAHETERATIEDSALALTTTLGASVARALTRRSAVQAGIEGSRVDFLDIDRTDYDLAAQLAYSIGLTRNLTLNASYRFSQRFSDEDENEFYRNIVSLGLTASF